MNSHALTYEAVTARVVGTLWHPGRRFRMCLLFTFFGILVGAGCWAYQIYLGLGASGINHPVMWGTYLINFVFWIEIGHAGSLMSALLYLTHARWRSPIARSAEAMTIFSVAIAGLFPFIHLGRSWIFYWLVPYPNQRNLWPNFQSPLIFDFWAAAGYLTISVLFWYTGLLPDLAIVRDRASGWRRSLYAFFALGWRQSHHQWRPYKSAYLYFAAITTAFVPIVASIVSWDYALTIIPGYHSTIYGPYFLVGAVYSGLAMLLTLLVPLRRIFRLEDIITTWVLERIAWVMFFMAVLMAYDYAVEYFLAWYGGEPTEWTTFVKRAVGYYSPMFWVVVVTVVFWPLLFLFKGVRTSPGWLFASGIIINIGMWLERFVIIIGPVSHDFDPYSWGTYWPSWVEWGILYGSFSALAFGFLLFTKYLPTIPITEIKEDLEPPPCGPDHG